MSIEDRFQRIDTFMFDVDGVMTDGGIVVMGNGDLARIMNTKDGYALQLAAKRGYRFFIISGSAHSGVERRMNNLGITNVYFGVMNKKAFVQKLIAEHNLDPQTILFMGDDMPDMPVFEIVAIGCCPADAVPDVKSAARYISSLPGGTGCVREIIEKVMKIRGHWGVDENIASK